MAVSIMVMIRHLMAVSLMVCAAQIVQAEVLRLNYEGFSIWLDCARRGAIKFDYLASKDTGNLNRHSSFTLDPIVPRRCQQTSSRAYAHPGQLYDRGHLVPANHLDGSAEGMRQSNHMTNILPQAARMNRGAWLRTEEIIECYRDRIDLRVIGGVYWGDDQRDDYFTGSHGVKTPSAFWKIIIMKPTDYTIAWFVPNTQEATRDRLDTYLISPALLEVITGETFPIIDAAKADRPTVSWPIPPNCDRG